MTATRPTAERRPDRRSTSTGDRRRTRTRSGDDSRRSGPRPSMTPPKAGTQSTRYGEARGRETRLWGKGFGTPDDPLPLLSGESPANLADYHREADRERRIAAAEREERRAAYAARAAARAAEVEQ